MLPYCVYLFRLSLFCIEATDGRRRRRMQSFILFCSFALEQDLWNIWQTQKSRDNFHCSRLWTTKRRYSQFSAPKDLFIPLSLSFFYIFLSFSLFLTLSLFLLFLTLSLFLLFLTISLFLRLFLSFFFILSLSVLHFAHSSFLLVTVRAQAISICLKVDNPYELNSTVILLLGKTKWYDKKTTQMSNHRKGVERTLTHLRMSGPFRVTIVCHLSSLSLQSIFTFIKFFPKFLPI